MGKANDAPAEEQPKLKPVSITRDMLIGATQRPMTTRDVVIPGFGRARVRALKGNERESLDDAALTTDAKTGRVSSDYRQYKSRAVAMALLDPDTNTPLFVNPLGEAALLGELEAVVLDRLFLAVDDLSALTRRAQEALGKELQTIGNTPS
jgi:hypothetical protein